MNGKDAAAHKGTDKWFAMGDSLAERPAVPPNTQELAQIAAKDSGRPVRAGIAAAVAATALILIVLVVGHFALRSHAAVPAAVVAPAPVAAPAAPSAPAPVAAAPAPAVAEPAPPVAEPAPAVAAPAPAAAAPVALQRSAPRKAAKHKTHKSRKPTQR
jgi:hypothetical protein